MSRSWAKRNTSFEGRLLEGTRQDSAGLRHSLEVLGRTAGQLLSLRAGDAQHLGDLVRHPLKALRCRIQTCLEGVACGLGAAAEHVGSGACCLLAHAGRLVGSFLLILGVVASSHIHPLWFEKQRTAPQLHAELRLSGERAEGAGSSAVSPGAGRRGLGQSRRCS